MRCGGGPISRHGALFTACGRFMLAPAGAALRVYSTEDCEPLASAAPTATASAVSNRNALEASCSAGVLVSEMLGHEANVTAVSRNPENDEQVCGLEKREAKMSMSLTFVDGNVFFF